MVHCILSILAVLTVTLPAVAQGIGQSELPPETIQRDPPTADDVRLITEFAEKYLPLLETGDPRQLKDAKEAIQEVAKNGTASAGFRRAFGQALLPRLNALATQDETQRSVVAILIMGDLATPEAIDALDRFLADDNGTSRFAAVVAYRSAFQGMANPECLILGRANDMVRKMGTLIENETNPLVLDASIRSMTRAARVGAQSNLPLGNLALNQLIDSVSQRIQGLSAKDEDSVFFVPCVKAIQDIREIVTLQAVQELAAPRTVQNSGGLCGDVFGYVFRRVRAGKVAMVGADGDLQTVQKARGPEISALKAADNLLVVCKDDIGIGDPNDRPERLAPFISRGDTAGDQQYIRGVMDTIGDGGLLTQTGFNFDTNRFLR